MAESSVTLHHAADVGLLAEFRPLHNIISVNCPNCGGQFWFPTLRPAEEQGTVEAKNMFEAALGRGECSEHKAGRVSARM